MRLVPVLPLVLIVAGLAAAQEPGPAALVKDLESDNAKTSQIAEFELVKAGSDAVPLLLPYLRDERRDMRLRVVKMFGRMGADAKEARASLDKLLGGEDRGMANLAARSLVRIDPHHDAAVKRLMKSSSPISRIVLCRSLARGKATVVPHLQKLLEDRHKGVREKAGLALVEVVVGSQPKIAGPVLFSLLRNDSYVVRRAAITGIGRMDKPPKSAADKLRPLLASSSTQERVAVIQCLCDSTPRPTWLLSALADALQDPKEKVQRAARVGLLLYDPDHVKKFFAAKEWQKRRSAAKTLRFVQVEDERSPAIPLLVRLLQDPEAEVRRAAATSLGELAPHSRLAMTELKLALRDRQPAVRIAALKALCRFRQSEDKVPEVEMAALVDDADIAVRAAAIRALPTFSLEVPLLNRLILRLGDEHVLVRRAAFQQLRWRVQADKGQKLGVELRRRAFAAALGMPDAKLLKQARAGLRMKNIEPKGEDFLLRFLEHENPKLRAQAATAFGEMDKDARKHLPKLNKLLEDPEPKVRSAAKRAIERIEHKSKAKKPKPK